MKQFYNVLKRQGLSDWETYEEKPVPASIFDRCMANVHYPVPKDIALVTFKNSGGKRYVYLGTSIRNFVFLILVVAIIGTASATTLVNSASTNNWASSSITFINVTKDLSSGNLSVGFLWDTFSGNSIYPGYIISGKAVESSGYLTLIGSGVHVRKNLLYNDNFNASIKMRTVVNGTATYHVPYFSYIRDMNTSGNSGVVYIRTTNTTDNEVDWLGIVYSSRGLTVNRYNWNTIKISTSGDTTIDYINGVRDINKIYGHLSNIKNQGIMQADLQTGGNASIVANFDDLRYWNNNTGEVQIFRQNPSVGVINRTRLVIYDTDFNLTVDLYAKSNSTTTWALLQANATNNTWYDIPYNIASNSEDFRVVLNGNSTDTPILSSLEWGSTSPAPTISFVSPPTDPQNATVNRLWSNVSTLIRTATNGTSFINWNRSLVGWWRFEEGSGRYAYDSSGYGNTGTLVNLSTTIDNGINGWASTGKFGNGMLFNGTLLDPTNNHGYVRVIHPNNYVSNPLDLVGATQASWFTWAKPNKNLSNSDNIGARWDTYLMFKPKDTFVLGWSGYSHNGWECNVWNKSDPTQKDIAIVYYTYPQVKDKWVHVGCTFNSTSLALYINGAKVANNDSIGHFTLQDPVLTVDKPNNEFYDFFIGTKNEQNEANMNLTFNGTLDDAMVWNRQLSPQEVAALYDSTNPLNANYTLLNGDQTNYTAFVQDKYGTVNNTETRYITAHYT